MSDSEELIGILLKMKGSGDLSKKNMKRANRAIELARKKGKNPFREALVLAGKIFLDIFG